MGSASEVIIDFTYSGVLLPIADNGTENSRQNREKCKYEKKLGVGKPETGERRHHWPLIHH
jgi:hypothetical protein